MIFFPQLTIFVHPGRDTKKKAREQGQVEARTKNVYAQIFLGSFHTT